MVHGLTAWNKIHVLYLRYTADWNAFGSIIIVEKTYIGVFSLIVFGYVSTGDISLSINVNKYSPSNIKIWFSAEISLCSAINSCNLLYLLLTSSKTLLHLCYSSPSLIGPLPLHPKSGHIRRDNLVVLRWVAFGADGILREGLLY